MKSDLSQSPIWRLLVSSALLVMAFGCEKVPTFQELTGQQQQNPTSTTTPSVTPAVAPKDTHPNPGVPSAKPVPIDPAKFLSELQSKRSEQINDDDLKTLANLESGREQVTFLNITRGGITDEALQNLTKLPELTQLDLTSTNIDGHGFAALRDCPKLRKLKVSGVLRMSPQGWEEISKLTQLEVLDASNNSSLSNVDVAKFIALTNLKELDLSSTPITDDAFRSLAEMERLEILKIEGNSQLKGNGLQAYSRTKPTLRELHAMRTPLHAAGLKHIKSISSLEFLDISNTSLSDQPFADLKGANNLVHLKVGANQLTNAGMQTVLTLSKLKILDLEAMQTINDQGLGILSKKSGLQTLNAKRVPFTRKGIEQFQKINKNCEVLISE